MTDEQINEIASSYMEMNADMYVSFLPSNLDKFARAVEQASRRATLERCADIIAHVAARGGDASAAMRLIRDLANGEKP